MLEQVDRRRDGPGLRHDVPRLQRGCDADHEPGEPALRRRGAAAGAARAHRVASEVAFMVVVDKFFDKLMVF